MHTFDPAITDFKPIVNKVKLRDRSEAIATRVPVVRESIG